MSKLAMFLYYISHSLYLYKIPLIPAIIQTFIRIVFSCHIPYATTIGKNTTIFCVGVVLHPKAVIGDNCNIGSCVSIVGSKKNPQLPIIGNNVWIGTGARILGSVKIGNNVVIGANSVVNKDIPDNCMIGGVPAKIIKENIDINDYK